MTTININDWKNSKNINTILDKQDCMIELNTINDKIIMIEDNECEMLNSQYIQDKNNKIVWRTLWSFLDKDSIENIMKIHTQNYMKNVVFKIQPKISFYSHKYELLRIVEELYNCQYNHNDNQQERSRKRNIVNKESWEIVEWDEVNILGESKNKMIVKNRKLIEDKLIEPKYRCVKSNCNFKKKNGQLCNKYTTENITITEDKYNTLMFENRIECCGIHKNQYRKMKDNQKTSKIEEVFGNLDYRVRNGIMCKC